MFACLALQHSTKTKNPGFATNSRKNTNYKTLILKKNQFKKRKKGKIHSHWKAKGMVPRSFK